MGIFCGCGNLKSLEEECCAECEEILSCICESCGGFKESGEMICQECGALFLPEEISEVFCELLMDEYEEKYPGAKVVVLDSSTVAIFT